MTNDLTQRWEVLKAGDTVFVEWHRHGARRQGDNDLVESKVQKIGRQWISIAGNYRFKKGETQLDGAGYSSPGNVWFSREEYQEDNARRREWSVLCEFVSQNRWSPRGLTRAQIIAALAILGAEVGKEG